MFTWNGQQDLQPGCRDPVRKMKEFSSPLHSCGPSHTWKEILRERKFCKNSIPYLLPKLSESGPVG